MSCPARSCDGASWTIPGPTSNAARSTARLCTCSPGAPCSNLATGPGAPYDTFDLVTALMLEATAFLATEDFEYAPGIHLLPKEVQDRAARLYLDEA